MDFHLKKENVSKNKTVNYIAIHHYFLYTLSCFGRDKIREVEKLPVPSFFSNFGLESSCSVAGGHPGRLAVHLAH
jgi:hypothetical protein